MADGKPFKKGSIATYEDAPAEDLRKRKEDLRVGIRNPVLTSGEFFREVVTHAFITAVAVGYSAWGGIQKAMEYLFKHTEWAQEVFFKRGKGGQHISYMKDTPTYKEGLQRITHMWAERWFSAQPRSAIEIAEEIIRTGDKQGFSAGRQFLQEFIVRAKKGEIASDKLRDELLSALKAAFELDPQSHIGQYWHLFGEVERRAQEAMTKVEGVGAAVMRRYTSAKSLAEDAFDALEESVVGRAIKDNKDIINKYRVPATVILVAGATVFTALQSRKSAKRQKAIDQTAELTHIERLEKERAEAKRQDNAPQIAAS